MRAGRKKKQKPQQRQRMPSLCVGSVVELTPTIYMDKSSNEQGKMKGTVIYINHKHRFFTVNFNCGGGNSFRESFKFNI
jgi:hypothetical protein